MPEQKHGEKKVRNKKKLMRREWARRNRSSVEGAKDSLWLLVKAWEEAKKTSNEGKSGKNETERCVT